MSQVQCDSQILSRHYSCIKEPVLTPERMGKLRRQFTSEEYPYSVSLEIGEYPCTHRCLMCPQSTVPFPSPGRFMEERTLERILDHIDPDRDLSLEVSAMGETLLHPQALHFITKAKRRLPKARMTVATNGLLLDEAAAKTLVEENIDFIQVSLNTGSRRSYEWFCGSREYDTVVANLERLIDLRNRSGSSSKITTHILEIEELRGEFLPFVKRWDGRADHVHIRGYGNWGGMVDRNGLHGLHPVPEKRYPCVSLFCSLEVLSDGRACKCFLHGVPGAEDFGCVGSLLDRSVQEIWKGAEMQRFREMHFQGRFDELHHCKDCRCWSLFPNIWGEKNGLEPLSRADGLPH